MNKSAVLQSIIESLRQEFANYLAISRKTRSTGNDAQTKAEGKYDTRSTEENYLADGQARQARAAMDAAVIYEKMSPETFPEGSSIQLGALVELEMFQESVWFFLGPIAGGKEVTCEGNLVTVITPDSPLGRQLLGLSVEGRTEKPPARVLAIR